MIVIMVNRYQHYLRT